MKVRISRKLSSKFTNLLLDHSRNFQTQVLDLSIVCFNLWVRPSTPGADNTTNATTTISDPARPYESTSWWYYVGWTSTFNFNRNYLARALHDVTAAPIQTSFTDVSQISKPRPSRLVHRHWHHKQASLDTSYLISEALQIKPVQLLHMKWTPAVVMKSRWQLDSFTLTTPFAHVSTFFVSLSSFWNPSTVRMTPFPLAILTSLFSTPTRQR